MAVALRPRAARTGRCSGGSTDGALVAWPGDLPGLPRPRRHDAHAARGGGGDAAVPHRALRQPQRLARRVRATPAAGWTRPATWSPRRSAVRRVRSCSRAAGPRPTTWPSSARSGATAAWRCARPPSTTPCCTRSSTWAAGSWPSTRRGPSTSTRWPTRSTSPFASCRSWPSTTRSGPSPRWPRWPPSCGSGPPARCSTPMQCRACSGSTSLPRQRTSTWSRCPPTSSAGRRGSARSWSVATRRSSRS